MKMRSDRVLRLQCTEGDLHDISFEVAMMSPRLQHIVQGNVYIWLYAFFVI